MGKAYRLAQTAGAAFDREQGIGKQRLENQAGPDKNRLEGELNRQTAGAVVAVLPITQAHVDDFHVAATAGCVQKA